MKDESTTKWIPKEQWIQQQKEKKLKEYGKRKWDKEYSFTSISDQEWFEGVFTWDPTTKKTTWHSTKRKKSKILA